MHTKLTLVFILLLSACANQQPINHYSHYLRNKNISQPVKQAFIHCYDYGCKTQKTVTLTETQWHQINSIFKTPSNSAEEERKKVAQAVQKFERIVGEITGTKADKRGTFRLYEDSDPKNKKFQHDCIDESTNTTVYLALLKQSGHIQFHHVTQPQSRQPFVAGNPWWHQTATIKDIQTGQQYAVDSWFEDNGFTPYIVPIESWFRNWKPQRDN
ncbi:MAG: hypothetical protein AAF988_03335 [Pseudomonadota bacterium]